MAERLNEKMNRKETVKLNEASKLSEPSKLSEIVIRGGTVMDESGERRADVLISDARIAAVAENLEVPRGAMLIEADGCVVAPGLVDLHAHLREPGGEIAETIETGTRSAALGGYTAVVAMPNTQPAIDCAAVARDVLALGEKALCEVAVAGAITLGRRGEKLAPLGEMAELGVRLFTDDGRGVQHGGLMRRALEYASGLGVVLAEHCEDEQLAAGGQMHEGAFSSWLGIAGQSSLAEEMMLARDLALVRLTGAHMHFLHLSTAGSIDMLRAARRDGLPVTAEVTPHHITISDAAVQSYDPVFKVNPPLRPGSDVEALREALVAGVVDAIATDHAPHAPERKEDPFDEAPAGMLGLETALSVAFGAMCLSAGEAPEASGADGFVPPGPRARMSLRDLLGYMSWRPARIAGLDDELHAQHGPRGGHGGPICPGAPANLMVFDPAVEWEVVPARLASRSRNTPYAGRRLRGKVRHTVCRGEVVVLDGEPQR